MESHGRFSRVLNVLLREKIEGPSRDFLKANPEPHPWPEQRPKTLGACGPPGFVVFGLAENLAKGLPLENPNGGLQYSSEGVHQVLKGPPEASIYNDTSEAFLNFHSFYLTHQYIDVKHENKHTIWFYNGTLGR